MNTFKVLLVSPKSYDDRFDQKLLSYHFFPYSVVYLVNYLLKLGLCQAEFFDLVAESREQLYRKVSAEHYDLIGFTSTAEARFANICLIRKLHQLSPHSRFVVGGRFFSVTATQALENVAEIDFVVRGEGEVTLAELVSALQSGREDFAAIDGLTFRQTGKIINNRPRKPEGNLDKFEIDYSIINNSTYQLLVPLKNWEDDKQKLAFPIMLGRGCDNHCIFCSYSGYLPFRVNKIESVFRQIYWAKTHVGAHYFMFTDPSFCERKDFVRDFCSRLIAERTDIEWYCESRPDVPLELLDLMRNAGCISTDFSMESGSARVLKTLRKDFDPKAIMNFAKRCHELGIRANYFTMISLPDERLEDVKLTVDLINILSSFGMTTSVAPLIIYPGTALETLAKDRGVLSTEFSWYDESYRCPYSFITPREISMPHYLEHLTECEVVFAKDQAELVRDLSLDRFHLKNLVQNVPHLLIHDFDEAFYLKRYPDVMAAVTAGDLGSGLEHFIRFGLSEGRLRNACTR